MRFCSGATLSLRAVAPLAGAGLALLLVSGLPGEARAQDSLLARPANEERLVDPKAIARSVGEACVFGAAAGAAGALMAGAPVAASGLAAPSVVSIALGAAAVGCTVGFVGATAANSFGVFWERRVLPELAPVPTPSPTPGFGDQAPPEIRASADGRGWSILRTSLQPARDFILPRSGE